jgi:hypothetical protein
MYSQNPIILNIFNKLITRFKVNYNGVSQHNIRTASVMEVARIEMAIEITFYMVL